MGTSWLRVLAALPALVCAVHAEAEPIASDVTVLNPVWSFSASVYESSAPDNPAPRAGELTYVYQLTALRRTTLSEIYIAYQGRPATDLGFVAGSGDASPVSFEQGQSGSYSGVLFFFWYTELGALEKTDLLYFLSANRPGPASFTIHDVPIADPGAFRTIGPSVPESGTTAAVVLSIVGIGLRSLSWPHRSDAHTHHEVTRCS